MWRNLVVDHQTIFVGLLGIAIIISASHIFNFGEIFHLYVFLVSTTTIIFYHICGSLTWRRWNCKINAKKMTADMLRF